MKKYKNTYRKYKKKTKNLKKGKGNKTKHLKKGKDKKTKYLKKKRSKSIGGSYEFNNLFNNLSSFIPKKQKHPNLIYNKSIAGQNVSITENYVSSLEKNSRKYLLFIRHAEKTHTISAPLTSLGKFQAYKFGQELIKLKQYFNDVFCTSVLFRSMQTAIGIQDGMGKTESILPLNYFREYGGMEKNLYKRPTYDTPTSFIDLPYKGYTDIKERLPSAIFQAYNTLGFKRNLNDIQGLDISLNVNNKTSETDFMHDTFISPFKEDTIIPTCKANETAYCKMQCCIEDKLNSIINTVYRDDDDIIFYPIVSHGSLMRDIYNKIKPEKSPKCATSCQDFMWSFVLPFNKTSEETSIGGDITFYPPENVFSGLPKGTFEGQYTHYIEKRNKESQQLYLNLQQKLRRQKQSQYDKSD